MILMRNRVAMKHNIWPLDAENASGSWSLKKRSDNMAVRHCRESESLGDDFAAASGLQ